MPFSIIIILFGLFFVVVGFSIAYKVWGLKAAVITGVGAFLAMSALMIVAIMIIVNSMPN